MDEKSVTPPLTIVFMGTPEFAVASLEVLHQSGHRIALVITQPDRPKGRGQQLVAPPVKTAAQILGLPTAQPASIRTAETVARIASVKPDLLVVVAYGQILPKSVLEIPTGGAINLHASLLPRYRGAAPIQWAIINQETQTGVTTMFMDAGMDTGALLLSEATDLAPDETAASLHDRLSLIGARLLSKTVAHVAAGEVRPTPQDSRQATYAPLLKKADGRIDWGKPAAAIDALVRGTTPWPGAFTFHKTQRLKIFRTRPLASPATAPPGTVVKGFADELRIATGSGNLAVLEIQSASGKRLPVKDFLRGYSIQPGVVLE